MYMYITIKNCLAALNTQLLAKEEELEVKKDELQALAHFKVDAM